MRQVADILLNVDSDKHCGEPNEASAVGSDGDLEGQPSHY